MPRSPRKVPRIPYRYRSVKLPYGAWPLWSDQRRVELLSRFPAVGRDRAQNVVAGPINNAARRWVRLRPCDTRRARRRYSQAARKARWPKMTNYPIAAPGCLVRRMTAHFDQRWAAKPLDQRLMDRLPKGGPTLSRVWRVMISMDMILLPIEQAMLTRHWCVRTTNG